MKVLLSNSIIEITKTTQAICDNNEKRITIIDSNTTIAFDIYPVTSDKLKKDFKKIVNAIKKVCERNIKTKQETKGK